MALKDEITTNTRDAFRGAWDSTEGPVVPATADFGLGNVGRKLDATVLYADSTAMVRGEKAEFSAEVYKTYLYAASRLIAASGGTVAAFDGDRVMGVFIGGSKNSNAVRCTLKINWVVQKVLHLELRKQYTTSSFTIRYRVGIDASEILVARTGIGAATTLPGSGERLTARQKWLRWTWAAGGTSQARYTAASPRTRSTPTATTCGRTSARASSGTPCAGRPAGGRSSTGLLLAGLARGAEPRGALSQPMPTATVTAEAGSVGSRSRRSASAEDL